MYQRSWESIREILWERELYTYTSDCVCVCVCGAVLKKMGVGCLYSIRVLVHVACILGQYKSMHVCMNHVTMKRNYLSLSLPLAL